MKRIVITILSVFALAGSMSSCFNLEENPIGLLAPESFFNDPDDVEAAVFGGYSYLASEEMWGRKLTLSLMLRSDMVDIGDPTTRTERIAVNDFNMDAGNAMVQEMWPRMWAVIGNCNYAIDGATYLEDVPEERINPIIAESYFLRAFTYYHLVRLYGDLPYIDFPVTDPERVANLPKSPVQEVYNGIISDLQFAKSWLPDQHPGDVRSRPTSGTAAAYLSSVYLTLGQWEQAYDEAKFVIDNQGAFNYALVNDFQDLFDATKNQGSPEHVFAVDFRGGDATSNLSRDYLAPLTGPRGPANEGWSVAVPSLEVFTTWNDQDYRRQVSFITEAMMDGSDTLTSWPNFGEASRGVSRPHVAKWFRFPGNAGANNRDSDQNYPAMRYAEILLIAAEALNEMNGGPNAEAEGYVNQVRERARTWEGGSSPVPENITSGLSYQDFLTAVLEERRLELAFEFKRWYDIKRRELGTTAFGPSGLEPDDRFDPNRDYLFPLPADEIQRNPNLLPQNPGY